MPPAANAIRNSLHMLSKNRQVQFSLPVFLLSNLCFLQRFPKGTASPWHTTLPAKSSVLYLHERTGPTGSGAGYGINLMGTAKR